VGLIWIPESDIGWKESPQQISRSVASPSSYPGASFFAIRSLDPVNGPGSATTLLTALSRIVNAELDHNQSSFRGYYESYATSHDALDRDTAIQQEVRNSARALVEAVGLQRAGKLPKPGKNLKDPPEIELE
jgi:hypothetical protein